MARRATQRDESFCLDVVQEAVLRILRTVRPVECEAQFRGWLTLVVRTTALDLLRGEARRQGRELAVAMLGQADVPNDPPDREQLMWLEREIARLDPELARMIDWRFSHRLTLRDIAARMGLSIGSVDRRLRQALVDLRLRGREWNDDG